jgi:hypothetical protein
MPTLPAADFDTRNSQDWKTQLDALFPVSLPSRASWTETTEIVRVLAHLSNPKHVNHAFFPTSGGLDLTGASLLGLDGLVELDFDKSRYHARPKVLQFESFPSADPTGSYEWNYFRLELETIPAVLPNPSALYPLYEETLELTPGNFVERFHYDAGEYNGQPLPPTARLVIRLLGGSLVIFQKTSTFNRRMSRYDGAHDNYTSDSFRDMIEATVDRLRDSTAAAPLGSTVP